MENTLIDQVDRACEVIEIAATRVTEGGWSQYDCDDVKFDDDTQAIAIDQAVIVLGSKTVNRIGGQRKVPTLAVFKTESWDEHGQVEFDLSMAHVAKSVADAIGYAAYINTSTLVDNVNRAEDLLNDIFG